MAFLKKNHQDIYEAMSADLRDRLPEITDFEQGSVIRSLLETIAFEQSVFYEQLDYVYNSSFVNTAQGINLEKVVAILDIYRNEPDYAIGEVSLFKEDDLAEEIVIPIGTQIVTEDNPDQKPVRKAYFTIEEAVLTPDLKSIEVKVQAEHRGKEMETQKDTLIILPRPITGVKSVTNPKAINFRGKQRETDEELRARAKKTLLAAGRASETSIEQALLAMPNVLDVKIKEQTDPPGVIDVYVDGLTENNSSALSKRLEEVRAAGIYARMKSAEKIKLSGIIKLLPHEDIITEERPKLEKQVGEIITKYIRSKKMGEPLSINQLTSEILRIKGVSDLEKYDLTFRESEIPYEYISTPPETVDTTVNPEEHDIVLLLNKKEETPPPTETEGEETVASENNAQEQKKFEFQVPTNPRNIFISDYSRFVSAELYVAAGDKELQIQVQTKVNCPNNKSSKTIVNDIKDNILDGLGALKNDKTTPLDSSIITGIKPKIETYFTSCKETVMERVGNLRIDPLGETNHGKFLESVKKEVGDAMDSSSNSKSTVFSIKEKTLKNAFKDVITAGEKPSITNNLQSAIKQTVDAIATECYENFPAEEIQTELTAIINASSEAELSQIRSDINLINEEITKLQTQLAAEKDVNAQNQIKQSITDQVNLLKPKQAEKENIQQQLSTKISTAQALIPEWKDQINAKIRQLTDDTVVGNLVSNIINDDDFDFALRLRAVTFYGKEYYNLPINVSFVETPAFDYLWIYSKNLRLTGTLLLDFPVTLTDSHKKVAFANVRKAMNEVLYNQRPEQNILLSDLIAAAEKQENVLAASFKKKTIGLVQINEMNENIRTLDRSIDDIVPVNYSEKVLLSDDYFTIEDKLNEDNKR